MQIYRLEKILCGLGQAGMRSELSIFEWIGGKDCLVRHWEKSLTSV